MSEWKKYINIFPLICSCCYACLHTLAATLFATLFATTNKIKLEEELEFRPLLAAASSGDVYKLAKLLTQGVDLNEIGCEGQTSLWLAAQGGHVQAVQILLREGNVHVNAACTNGVTPLIIATLYGHNEIVKLLLQLRFDLTVNSIDNQGRTALWYASREGNTNLVKLLLCRGACSNTTNSIGQSPLWIAAWYGRVDVVMLLLQESNPLVNQVDTCGCTPLWAASRNGRIVTVRLLLSCGADQNILPHLGPGAADMALQNGHMSVALLLNPAIVFDHKEKRHRSYFAVRCASKIATIFCLPIKRAKWIAGVLKWTFDTSINGSFRMSSVMLFWSSDRPSE